MWALLGLPGGWRIGRAARVVAFAQGRRKSGMDQGLIMLDYRAGGQGHGVEPEQPARGETTMLRIQFVGMTAALIASALAAPAQAQQPAPPPFATTKVDGTDNVYIFRYGGHQSMFIVTPQGVIATDPISERRPAKPYIEAIQAVTKAPIKYVIYSHSHFDHIAGGKPFKDLGALFVAQRNAKARIDALKSPDVVTWQLTEQFKTLSGSLACTAA
jgi:Metallo-beta-lactamase superfamily